MNDLSISIICPCSGHSRKPDEMIPLIEDLFEDLFEEPYLEFFAQTRCPDWSSWGKSIDKSPEKQSKLCRLFKKNP